jgi:acyl carrier protein
MESVTPSTRFVEDLGLDVLSALEIVVSLEKLLKIRLHDPEAAQVNCIRDFLDKLSHTAFNFAER